MEPGRVTDLSGGTLYKQVAERNIEAFKGQRVIDALRSTQREAAAPAPSGT